jgi:type I phosphodiesterase/nucleotide pyrophosphatase
MPFKNATLALLLCAAIGMSTFADARDSNQLPNDPAVRHVLLISVDGLHQNDLDWLVMNHPDSALAELVRNGVSYTQARTPFPSDSFPGLVGQVTGGNPKTTGIYYDDAYSRALLPAGTTACEGATPGAEVQYAENLDKDLNRLDAGQNIPGLYANFALISQLSSHPARDLIDPAQLPVDPDTCLPVYPHQYLKVNTVFEVAHAKGMHTAWSDKHPAYEILSGPSGMGVDDFFTPEIKSSTTAPGLPRARVPISPRTTSAPNSTTT